MKSVSILLALAFGIGGTWMPGWTWAGPTSGGKSAMGGGHSVTSPGPGAKSMPASPSKSMATSGSPFRLGQPCDVKGSSGFRSTRGFGLLAFSGPTYLIVDAYPLEAQVFLDGQLLGTGRDLVARAFPLAPGQHAVEIVAPGFLPYIAQFGVAQGSIPVRFRVALRPG